MFSYCFCVDDDDSNEDDGHQKTVDKRVDRDYTYLRGKKYIKSQSNSRISLKNDGRAHSDKDKIGRPVSSSNNLSLYRLRHYPTKNKSLYSIGRSKNVGSSSSRGTFFGSIKGPSKTMVMMMTQDNYSDNEGDTPNARRPNAYDPHSAPTSSSLHTSSRHCVCGAEYAEGSSSSSTFPEDFPISVKLKMCRIFSKQSEEEQGSEEQISSPGQWPHDTKTTIVVRPLRQRELDNVPVHNRGGYDRGQDQSSSFDREGMQSSPLFLSCESTDEPIDNDPGRTIFGIGGEEHDVTCPCHPQHPDYVQTLLDKVTGKQLRDENTRNLIILRLLHEVVHLINSDSPIREEAFRITQTMHSSSSPDFDTCMPCQQPMEPHPLEPMSQHSSDDMMPHPLEPTADMPKKPMLVSSNDASQLDEEEPPSGLFGEDDIAGIDTDELMKDEQDNVCICPHTNDICPVHGPIKVIVNRPGEEGIDEMEEECDASGEGPCEVCICPSQEDVCPVHGLKMVPIKKDKTKRGDLSSKPSYDLTNYDPCFNYNEYAMYTLPKGLCETIPPIWGSPEAATSSAKKDDGQEPEVSDSTEAGKKGFINSCALFGKWLMYTLTSKFKKKTDESAEDDQGLVSASGHEMSPIDIQVEECFDRFNPCTNFGEYIICALSQKIFGDPNKAFEMTEGDADGEEEGEDPLQSTCARILNRFLNEDAKSGGHIDIKEIEPDADYCVKLGDYIIGLLVSKQLGIPAEPPCCGKRPKIMHGEGEEEGSTEAGTGSDGKGSSNKGPSGEETEPTEKTESTDEGGGSGVVGVGARGGEEEEEGEGVGSAVGGVGARGGEEEEEEEGEGVGSAVGAAAAGRGDGENSDDDIFYDCEDTSEANLVVGTETTEEHLPEEECEFCDMVHNYIRDLAEGRDPDERLILNIIEEKEKELRDQEGRGEEDSTQEDDSAQEPGTKTGDKSGQDEAMENESENSDALNEPLKNEEITSEMDECEECDCCYCRARCHRDMKEYSATRGGGGDQCDEMKIFIETLICDLEAMQYARNQRKQPLGYCDNMNGGNEDYESGKGQNGFPVTISQVEELGSSSLYVKWKIIDSNGIGGYELLVDGQLTNRYYNGSHKAAVITNVDVSKPHKVTLIAKPCSESDIIVPTEDCSDMVRKSRALPPPEDTSKIEAICEYIKELNMTKALCKPPTNTSKWTPSVFVYNPEDSGCYE